MRLWYFSYGLFLGCLGQLIQDWWMLIAWVAVVVTWFVHLMLEKEE
jgi:hypothetical protein